RQPDHHLSTGLCPAQFKKAEMALGDFGAASKIELRPAAVLTPPAKCRREVGIARHEYLPGSCVSDTDREDATRQRGGTGGNIGRVVRSSACDCLELPRRYGGGGDTLSHWGRRSADARHIAVGHRLSVRAADRVDLAGALAAAERLAWHRRSGTVLLRVVFHPLQPRCQLHDGGARQSRAGDIAAADDAGGRYAGCC